MLVEGRIHPTAWNTAFKSAFSLTLAASIALYFHWELFWWAIFISFISIQPDFGSSLQMTLYRFIGTYIGGIAGAMIGLTIQYPWIYYLLIVIFIFCGVCYFLKTNFSWPGYLCVLVGTGIALIGPMYPDGVIYYAIERCLQISFALLIVIITLLLLRAEQAYQMMRVRIPLLFSKLNTLWGYIYAGFVDNAPVADEVLQTLIREISTDLDRLFMMLDTTRYEFRKKNFNRGRCSELLRLMKRMQSLMMSLNETVRYIRYQDFSSEAQELILKAHKKITVSIDEVSSLVIETSQYYDLAKDNVEQEFREIFENRLYQRLQTKNSHLEINLYRVAWFTLLERAFYLISMMRRIVVLMNSNRDNPKLTEQLGREMTWLKKHQTQERNFFSLRIRSAAHVALASLALIGWQCYFNWTPMFSMLGILCVFLIVLSLIIPTAGNMGWGILGGLLGGIYSYFALSFLHYYPSYVFVLMFLYLATWFASYYLTVAKLYNKKYTAFAIFFIIIVVLCLTAQPGSRGDFSMVLNLVMAMLLGTLFYVIISKIIFKCDYKQHMRNELSSILLSQETLLNQFHAMAGHADLLQKIQYPLHAMTQKINFARRAIQYCQDQEFYDSNQLSKIRQVTYSCELMLLTDLNFMLPYVVLSDVDFIKTLYEKIHAHYQAVTSNLRAYAHNIQHNCWKEVMIEDTEAMKQELDRILHDLIPEMFHCSLPIRKIRVLSCLYSAFNRLFDVQTRLLAIKEFKF